MSKFFINRPIVAMVIAILMVIVGAISIAMVLSERFRRCDLPSAADGAGLASDPGIGAFDLAAAARA